MEKIIHKNYNYLIFFTIFISLIIKIVLINSLEISNDTLDYIKIGFFYKKYGLINSYIQDFYFEEPYGNFHNEIFASGISAHDRPPLLSLISLLFINFNFNQNDLAFILSIFTAIFSFVYLVFISKIFRLLNYSKTIKLVGIIIFSLNPHVLYYSSKFLTEIYAFTFIVILVYLMMTIKNNLNLLTSFKLSATFSLLFLTKTIFFYFPIFFLLILIIFFKFYKKINYIKFFFSVSILYSMILSPLIFNSLIKSKSLMLTRTNYMLFYCNNNFQDKFIKKGLCNSTQVNKTFIEEKLSNKMSYVYHQKVYGAKIKKYLLENYESMPKILLNRLKNYFHLKPNPFQNKFKITDIISIIFIFFIYLMTLLYFLNIKKIDNQKIYILFSFSLIFYSCALTILFWGVPRFRFPTEVFLYLFSLSYLNFKLFKIIK